MKQYKDAITDYDKVIELNKQYTIAYSNSGEAKEKLGLYKEAIEDYNKALKN